jgi:hypothetical protein
MVPLKYLAVILADQRRGQVSGPLQSSPETFSSFRETLGDQEPIQLPLPTVTTCRRRSTDEAAARNCA